MLNDFFQNSWMSTICYQLACCWHSLRPSPFPHSGGKAVPSSERLPPYSSDFAPSHDQTASLFRVCRRRESRSRSPWKRSHVIRNPPCWLAHCAIVLNYCMPTFIQLCDLWCLNNLFQNSREARCGRPYNIFASTSYSCWKIFCK